MSFLQAHTLWLDIVLAACFAGAATGAVGVHANWRRVTFLPAALSQLAGLGVVVAFLVAHLAGTHEAGPEMPRLFAILFAALGALALGLWREGKGATREWMLAGVYLASSTLILIVGGFVPEELHDVNDILFGNAIVIEHGQMLSTVAVSAVLLFVHGWLARPFAAVAFDAPTASAHGVGVKRLDALVFVTMGIAAALSTRVVGALPAFAFAVFPSACGTSLARSPRKVIAIASLFGALSAFLGYWASFELSLPTGACMAGVAAMLLVLVKGVAWLRG